MIEHGNSAEIVPRLGQFDIVLADPPYAPGSNRKEWAVTASVAIALNHAARAVKPDGVMLVMTSASGRGEGFVESAVGSVLRYSRLLVWHKRFVNSRVAGPFRWDIVPIRVYGRGCFGRPMHSSCFVTDGPINAKRRGDTGHPAELPLPLCEWMTAAWDDGRPKRVLDPFAGSGSLLLPSATRGWEVVGVEMEKKWVCVARERLRRAAA